MKDGWIKVAAGSVPVRLADPEYNKQQILCRMNEADEAGVNLLVLPELCVTGYSCGDLFFSEALLTAALCAAEEPFWMSRPFMTSSISTQTIAGMTTYMKVIMLSAPAV